MDERLERLALKLFEAGAMEFGSFPFKIHERYHDFPLSPNKINLRLPDNGGNLTPSLVAETSWLMWLKALIASVRFDLVVGLPRAGEPFAEAMARCAAKSFLRMEKEELPGGKRCLSKIISGVYHPRQSVLALDDVISQATTKVEGVARIKEVDLRVAAIIVVVDREEGGSEYLQSLGYKVFSLYNLSELLIFLFEVGRITLGQLEDSLAYSKEIKKLFLQTLSA